MEYIDMRKAGKEGFKQIHSPVLPVETKQERVNMLSAISSEGSVRFMVYRESMNQQRLIRASERKVFLILDNLKVHHGKIVKAWLEKHKEKIEVFFPPPYAEFPTITYCNRKEMLFNNAYILPGDSLYE